MKRSTIFLLFLSVILGLSLRLINIGVEPFWGDETLSLDIARHFSSVGQMLSYLREVEFHPPLYYVMLHYWVGAFGISEFAVHSLSLLFGLGCVILTYLFSYQMFKSRKAGIISAFIVAVLPFQIEYSQEARPYIIYCFFGILAGLWLYKYYETKRAWYLSGYILASLAGFYLHYSYGLILAATALWSLYQALSVQEGRSREFLIWAVSHSLIFLGFAFWLEAVWYKIFLGRLELFGMQTRPIPASRTTYFFEHTLDNLIWINKQDVVDRFAIFFKFIAQAAILVGSFSFFHKFFSNNYRRPLVFLVWLTVIPLILFLIVPFSVPYTTIVERHVILFTIIFAVFFGLVASRMSKKAMAVFISVFVLSLVPYTSEVLGDDSKWDHFYKMKEISEYINEYYKPGDMVIVPEVFFRTDAAFYLKDEIPVVGMLPADHYGLDIWNTRQTLGLVENEYQTRMFPVGNAAIDKKFDNLNKLHKPQRIWLFGFLKDDFTVHQWFIEEKWRPVFRPSGDVFRVELYAR